MPNRWPVRRAARLRFADARAPIIDDQRGRSPPAWPNCAPGCIVAVKGIGGYHLMCDARNDAAVQRLRERKGAAAQAAGGDVPGGGADGLDAVRRELEPDAVEAAALRDPARADRASVRQRPDGSLSRCLAPGLREIGAFLPCSPLHALLLHDFGGPLVATSGNLSGEPVLTDEREAAQRLAAVADAFVHHDRPIVRPDDPVLRVVGARTRPIRTGRGTAPLRFELARRSPSRCSRSARSPGCARARLAAASCSRRTSATWTRREGATRFAQVAEDLQQLYGVRAARLVVDAHPGYASRAWADSGGLPMTAVQHHRAHASAAAWERPDVRRWLVLAWDGVGLGDDGTLWGGEALVRCAGQWQRASAAAVSPARRRTRPRASRAPPPAPVLGRGPPLRAGARRARTRRSRLAARTERAADERRRPALRCRRLPDPRHRHDELRGPGGDAARGARRQRRAGDGDRPAARARDAAGLWRIDWRPLLDRLLDPRRRCPRARSGLPRRAGAGCRGPGRPAAQNHRIRRRGPCGGVFQNRLLCDEIARRFDNHGLAPPARRRAGQRCRPRLPGRSSKQRRWRAPIESRE